MDEPIEDIFKRVFEGRVVNMDANYGRPTANEEKGVPLEKMYRCHADGGCGKSKPANAFYKDIIGICCECAGRLSAEYKAPVEYVSTISSCFSTTASMLNEAKAMAKPEDWKSGYDRLVVKKGIERGSRHFILSMLAGAQTRPMDLEFFADLQRRYRGWLFNEFNIPKDEYSNKPNNGLL